MVKLVRIDIAYEISILSQYLVQPQAGPFVQALHLFKYLDIHKDIDLEFNPEISELSDPLTIKIKIEIKRMKKMYIDAVNDLLPNSLTTRVKPIQVICFVESDHDSDKIMSRSQYSIIPYCH